VTRFTDAIGAVNATRCVLADAYWPAAALRSLLRRAPAHVALRRIVNEVTFMSPRLDYRAQAPELFRKFGEFSQKVKGGSIESSILDLVFIRASQLNGCTFCLDMHHKQATIEGERPLRLYHLAGWRESPLFSPRERACLAWTEALTHLSAQGIPDDVYERVRTQLSEKEITDLTYAVSTINVWNRINVAFRPVPGSLDKEWGLDKAKLSA
jgi:AhpD family alkylhydroperoxidase